MPRDRFTFFHPPRVKGEKRRGWKKRTRGQSALCIRDRDGEGKKYFSLDTRWRYILEIGMEFRESTDDSLCATGDARFP